MQSGVIITLTVACSCAETVVPVRIQWFPVQALASMDRFRVHWKVPEVVRPRRKQGRCRTPAYIVDAVPLTTSLVHNSAAVVLTLVIWKSH